MAERPGSAIAREPYESDAVEIGFTTGNITTLEGILDEEQKRDLEERLANRIPVGFAPGSRKRMKGGGRRPGSWPKIPWLT